MCYSENCNFLFLFVYGVYGSVSTNAEAIVVLTVEFFAVLWSGILRKVLNVIYYFFCYWVGDFI